MLTALRSIEAQCESSQYVEFHIPGFSTRVRPYLLPTSRPKHIEFAKVLRQVLRSFRSVHLFVLSVRGGAMAEETPKVAFKVCIDTEVVRPSMTSSSTLLSQVTFKKDNFDFELPVTTKISELKALLEEKTGVTQPMQKLSYKGT